MKRFAVPVIIRATGIVTKRLKKYLETIAVKYLIDSVQGNSCTRDIAHNREVLQFEF